MRHPLAAKIPLHLPLQLHDDVGRRVLVSTPLGHTSFMRPLIAEKNAVSVTPFERTTRFGSNCRRAAILKGSLR